MVQEQLCQQAQILSVTFILPTVNFKETYRVFSINFVARWMSKIALFYVPLQTFPAFPVLETELADVDAGHGAHFLGVWREVPRFDSMLTELYQLDIFHASHNVVVVHHHTSRLPRRWRRRNVLRVFILCRGGFSLSIYFFL